MIQPVSDSSYLEVAGELRSCAQLYTETDHLIFAAGVMDARAVRIPGFPYLRADRFLYSFKDELATVEDHVFWLALLRELDQTGRSLEIKNLLLTKKTLQQLGTDTEKELITKLQECGEVLIKADIKNSKQIALLKDRSRVPDNYSDTARAMGLYPLTKIFASQRIERLHKEIKQTFELSAKGRSEAYGELKTYSPVLMEESLSNKKVAELLTQSTKNPLGMPILTGEKIEIDNKTPEVYRLLSYTRFNGQVLVQLNYTLWFSECPSKSAFDILTGKLDGITWRVTLDGIGKPLMHDAMHNCGCYHMFFPTSHVSFRNSQNEDEEPLLVPAIAPDISEEEKMRIRIGIHIASGTRYVEGISSGTFTSDQASYTRRDYEELRAIPKPERGNKSMFSENGMVTATSLKERFLLWPMGIPDPGAMRQWGNHATAFVGRRHFDDPCLLESYYKF